MKIIKEFVSREIIGEYILVPTGTTAQEFNGLITINATAKFIWDNIEKAESLEQLVQMVLDEFEIDEERATIDTQNYVMQLLEKGFIDYSNEDKGW